MRIWRVLVKAVLTHSSRIVAISIFLSALIASAVQLSPVAATNSTFTSTFQTSADTTLIQYWPDLNYGGWEELGVLSSATWLSYRIILKFDTSAVIPAGSTINSASLKLHSYDGSAGGRTFNVYRLTQTDWVEGTATGQAGEIACTWNYRVYNTLPWTTPGGTYTTTDGASAIYPSTDGWVSWGVTAQVQTAVNSVGGVAHFLIKDQVDGASPQTAGFFYSREYTTNPSWMPQLVVTYSAPSYRLNLKAVMADGSTALAGASITVNNGTDQVKTVGAGGWGNYTGMAATSVTIRVTWQNSLVNGPFTQTMGADRTLTLITQVYSNYALSWVYNDGSTAFTPTQVQLLAPNSTLVTVSGSYTLSRVQAGTWTVKRVSKYGGNVVPATNPTFAPTANSQSMQIACRIYSITLASTMFKDGGGTSLYTPPSAFTITTPNATSISAYGTYWIPNGTSTLTAATWEGTPVVPTTNTFDASNGSPSFDLKIYGLNLKHQDTLGNLLTVGVQLTFPNSTQLVETPIAGWTNIAQVQAGTITLTTTITVSDNERYTLTSSPTISLTGTTTQTETWLHECRLTVNSEHGTPGGAGWYASGATPSATVAPLTTPGTAGTRYVFTGWGGDASGSTSPSNPIIMNSPKTATANWTTQYLLTVSVIPPGSGSTDPAAGSYWHDSGSVVQVTAFPIGDNVLDHWSLDGGNVGGANPYTVSMGAAHELSANFAMGPVSVTVTSSPSGPGFVVVDGVDYSTPHAFSWAIGSGHNLTALSTATGGSGTRYVWLSWNDTGAQTHNYIVPGYGETVTATYGTQYQLTVSVNPPTSGSTTPTAGSYWYDSGSGAPVAASPLGGYVFDHWMLDGGDVGSSNPYTVTMGDAHELVANFAMGVVSVTVTSSPAGAGFVVVDDAAYSTPHVFSWTIGSLHNITALSSVQVVSGVRYVWQSWNDTGAQTHWVTIPGAPVAFAADYQTQYLLTMSVDPSGVGSTTPITGWQNSGALVAISASANPAYSFQSWSGSGAGNYTGTANPSSVTMNGAITEVAEFAPSGSGPVTMTVSYQAVGGGSGYLAPVFNYMSSGVSRIYTLTGVPYGVSCDGGTAWSIALNPLSGSGPLERWFSVQSLGGTASNQTIVFSFQHQYYLTMQVNPPSGGTLTPASGWQNEGASVSIQLAPEPGHIFQSWSGTGSGSYSGTDNPASITVDDAIVETATTTTLGSSSTSICRFAATASVVDGKNVLAIPPSHDTLSLQQLLLPLSQVLPASGLVMNRRARRGVKGLMLGGRHGGLSGLTSAIVLVILVASAIVGLAGYYYAVSGGAASQPNLVFSGSVIKVSALADTGTVYIRMYNAGTGSVQVKFINVTANAGNFGLDFSSGAYGAVSADNCNCTISRSQGVGVSGMPGEGFLSLPAGTTTSIMIVVNSDMSTYFDAGTQYQSIVVPVQAAEMTFSIPSEGGQ